jgi:polysaccharide pyruvyl transferase WcaK-like protein
MNIKRLIHLPWKLKEVLGLMARDVAEVRLALEDLTERFSALKRGHAELVRMERRHAKLERRHAKLGRRQSELTEQLLREREAERSGGLERERLRQQEIASLRETLSGAIRELREQVLAEVREQGHVMETAARLLPRAAAEMKLRERLIARPVRQSGVSVLITCWNHAGFLTRAVGSAVAALESLPVPGEVLILDDASRDGSAEVAQGLVRADARVRLIQSDENLGLPRARNVLLSQARFRHAMILDSDNQLVPSGIAALYAAACQTEAVLAYGNILQVDQSGSVMGVISNERVTANLLKENWIDAMALVRTDRLLELGGYDSQWLYGLEDWELNQRLFSLGEPMVFVPVLVGKYTVLPNSMIREAPLTSRYKRGLRIFASVKDQDPARYNACTHHPALGTLWASAGSGWTAPAPVGRAVPRRATSRLKVLVISSGGVRNYGDDAILLATLQRLERIRPDCVPTVVSDGPSCPPLGRLGVWDGTCDEFCAGLDPDEVLHGCRDDTALFGELSSRLELGSHTRSDLKAFDVVLFAGGGNLNIYWPELIARRAAIAAGACAAGVPYILSGQGVGPISAGIIPMVSFLVGGASAVATRDSHSLQLLLQIVGHGPPMQMVGDDALGLRVPDTETTRAGLAQIGIPLDRPLLGFHAREASYVGFTRDELADTARRVDDFAAQRGYVVVGVPINMQADGHEAALLAELASGPRRRARWHVANHAGDIAAIAGVIKASSAVVAHSYHAAIFALESRIPTLLFARTEYYRLKAEALRTAFGIPVPVIASPELADGAIARALEQIALASWSRAAASADIDLWLDGALWRAEGGAGARSIPRFDREALGIAG